MKFWVTFGVLFCLILPNATNAEMMIQRCGSRLADLLSQLCTTIYHSPQSEEEKRDISLPLPGSVQNWLLDHRYPGISAEYRGRNRYARGIVDECCRQACDINTLLSYCG